MAMKINVAQDIDNNDVLQVIVGPDNSVSYETLNAIFPGLSLLKYKDANTNKWTCVNVVNKNFEPGHGDTWHSDIIYVPVFPAPVSSASTTSASLCARAFAFVKDSSLSQRLYQWLTGKAKAHTKLE